MTIRTAIAAALLTCGLAVPALADPGPVAPGYGPTYAGGPPPARTHRQDGLARKVREGKLTPEQARVLRRERRELRRQMRQMERENMGRRGAPPPAMAPAPGPY